VNIMRALLRSLLPALALLASAAQAQAPAAPARTPAEELRRLCDTISMRPADGLELARRSECVLAGVLSSENRIDEARSLARAAYRRGEPTGGLMLYLVYRADPAYQYVKDGKVDAEAYRKLAARSVQERQEQIEAIEGLGMAAGRNHPAAGALLAGYFHDTAAPRNVSRTGALAGLLMRDKERAPVVERYAREADVIARVAQGTKASVRGFLETHQLAQAAARTGYRAQAGGKTCEAPQLVSVSSGDIAGAEFLPLEGNMVKDSYLLKGSWSEFWTFKACDQEVPVKVEFVADGWGGTTSTARHNKGD
jgi:hypothetical protein